MTSRRAQKRDGTRKGRQGDTYLRELIMREYDEVREAWLADRSPFRPVHPPSPPVSFRPEHHKGLA
jgi:hypothetical protein